MKVTKPVIAVDIDDVLSDTVPAFLAFTNKKWGLNFTPQDYNEHLAVMWKTSEEEAKKRVLDFHDSGMSASYKHDETALPVLEELSKKYTLVIVTSRRRHLEEMSRAWLETHYPGVFSDIYFAGIWDTDVDAQTKNSMTKASICLEIGAKYLIDDQPKHCEAAAEVGIACLLFGDYPWNKMFREDQNITRVIDWKAVGEYFNAKS